MDSASPSDVWSKLRALGVGAGVGAGGLVVGTLLALSIIVGLQLAGVSLGPLLLIVVALVFTQGVAFGGVALGYLSWRGRSLSDVGIRLPSLLEVAITVGGWFLTMGILVVAGLVVQALNAPTATNQVAEIGQQNPEVLLLLIPASFLLIGPGEELLYRGVVQNRLREAFSAPAAVVLAAVLFAAIHFVALTGSTSARLVTLVILFFPSLVLGAAYEYTENLVVPSLIHGAYNATQFAILYVALRFGPEMAG